MRGTQPCGSVTMFKLLLVAYVGVCLSSAQVVQDGQCDTLNVQAGFELADYMGLWHTIESYPSDTQYGTCKNANYTRTEAEQYHQLPELFHLDNYEQCLSQERGVYCLGMFDLTSGSDASNTVLNLLKEYSSDPTNFNHTRLHRGYCLSARCQQVSVSHSHAKHFEECVNIFTESKYGLKATLAHLDYCKTGDKPRGRPVDIVDMGFAFAVGFLLTVNIIGTLYDFCRNRNEKPNIFLMAWSLRENWNRLIATYEDGDPRLLALSPINGLKTIVMILVMLVHTCFSNFIAYIYNTHLIEETSRNPLSSVLFNGTMLVQLFVVITSFLLVYNLLLHVEKKPGKSLSLTMLPMCLFQRLFRIVPVYLLVLGFACTWWSHAHDGVLWSPFIEEEVGRCRRKWWTQILFVNNIVKSEETCLIQTWFLAVDMQLYVVAAILTLGMGRWPKALMSTLGVMFIGAIVAIFVGAYYWGLKSVLYLMTAENIRKQLSGEPSLTLLYMAPWGSLPASLIGTFVAFLYYEMEKRNFRVGKYMIFRIAYRLSFPLLLLWCLSGYWIRDITTHISVSLYTAIDRPVVDILVVVFMIGACSKVDDIIWRFLSWRGWQILSRLSLTALLIHWVYTLSIVGSRIQATEFSLFQVVGDWLATIGFTYVTSVLAALLVEFPMQKFLLTIFG